jgi:hypothetical protein
VLLCKTLDFAKHNNQFQTSVEVIVSNVPESIGNVPELFWNLCIMSILLFLDTVFPNGS